VKKILRRILWRPISSFRWRLLARWLEGDILDVGCGSGHLFLWADKKRIGKYVGIDIDDNRTIKTFEFFQIDLNAKSKKTLGASFDRVILGASIEHVENPQEVLKWCLSLLKSDGLLVMTTPTPIGQNLLKFVFGGGDEHINIYDRKGLTKLLNDTGFLVTRYQTFEFGANQLVVASRK
jgi:2-polyprenyl-3-methyl-5-hydroxy-6-metoxy-1,4-benzoquinol methylase